MLGRDLTAQFAARHQVVPLTRHEADVTDPKSVLESIGRAKPEVVIHAAAFTAVDDCEGQPELALRVNAEGTRNVALACVELRIPMLYISTDYVFDGTKPTPYTESDQPNPINVYGRSKLEGERFVQGMLGQFWIVRTSWLFGLMGKNFVRTILGKAESGESLQVVNDQVGAPTYTADLAEKLEQIVERGGPGIYHVTNQGYCSWFDFAQEILEQTGLRDVRVLPIPTSASNRPAPRPKNSRLANLRLESLGFSLLPPWQDALRRYLLRDMRANI